MEHPIETGEAQSIQRSYELYVEGLMAGKTRYRAGIDAGFSKYRASHAKRLIEGPETDKLIQTATPNKPSGQTRTERYVEGLMDGKSKAQAALNAGFSESQARNPAERIEGPITDSLMRSSLAKAAINLDVLAWKVRAGLDATRPLVVPGVPGQAPTVQQVEDYATQLRFVQHAHKLLRDASPKVDEPQQLNVRIVSVGSSAPEQLVKEYTTDLYKY
jgi:hypothetical protein